MPRLILALLLVVALTGCRDRHEAFREELEGWYSAVGAKSYSCDALGRSLNAWEERHGEAFIEALTEVVDHAASLEGEERQAFLEEIAVVPDPRARRAMNRCVEHPVAGLAIRRMAERLSSLFRLEAD